MTDIPAIRKLLDGVTEGPWHTDVCYVVGQAPGGRPGGEVILRCGPTVERLRLPNEANARFIAASRTLIPQLCDEAEKWRNECTYLREEKTVLESAIHSMKSDESLALALKQNAEQLQYEAERKLTAALARIAELEAKGERK